MLVLANIFQPLITVFEAVLKFFHNTVGVPWGWSIVLLTITIRAVLVPLTLKQFHSMQQLQRLQPELKRIQNKYKDDKQRQQQELMQFYREHKVNPLGSCLPLLAQFPVFISLYYMLRTDLRKNICPAVQHAYQALHHLTASHTTPCSTHLPNFSAGAHGAGFLFINDLTTNATGAALIVLIVLYIGSQLASSLMMSSPTMDKTQRQIMLFMPLIFVFIMISLPTGVMVYWITTNFWTILQQYIVKRRLGPMVPITPDADATPAARSGSGRGAASVAAAAPADGDRPNGASGGLSALLRGRSKGEEPEKVGAAARARGAAPPPPPRKKKKRSGRRR